MDISEALPNPWIGLYSTIKPDHLYIRICTSRSFSGGKEKIILFITLNFFWPFAFAFDTGYKKGNRSPYYTNPTKNTHSILVQLSNTNILLAGICWDYWSIKVIKDQTIL